MVGSIHNRIAAFEHLAETSKTQSGVMQIAPNPTTGFSALNAKDSLTVSKETYAAAATSVPFAASKTQPDVDSRNNVQEVGTPEVCKLDVKMSESNHDILGNNSTDEIFKVGKGGVFDAKAEGNSDFIDDSKPIQQILEEEEKKLNLDESPVPIITVSSKEISNSKEVEELIDHRDDNSVSPLSFLGHKIDATREVNDQFSPTFGAIDEVTESEQSDPSSEESGRLQEAAIHRNGETNDNQPKKKTIMNNVDEEVDDFFAFLEMNQPAPVEVGNLPHETDEVQMRPNHNLTEGVTESNKNDVENARDKKCDKGAVKDHDEDDVSLAEYFQNLLSESPMMTLLSPKQKENATEHELSGMQSPKQNLTDEIPMTSMLSPKHNVNAIENELSRIQSPTQNRTSENLVMSLLSPKDNTIVNENEVKNIQSPTQNVTSANPIVSLLSPKHNPIVDENESSGIQSPTQNGTSALSPKHNPSINENELSGVQSHTQNLISANPTVSYENVNENELSGIQSPTKILKSENPAMSLFSPKQNANTAENEIQSPTQTFSTGNPVMSLFSPKQSKKSTENEISKIQSPTLNLTVRKPVMGLFSPKQNTVTNEAQGMHADDLLGNTSPNKLAETGFDDLWNNLESPDQKHFKEDGFIPSVEATTFKANEENDTNEIQTITISGLAQNFMSLLPLGEAAEAHEPTTTKDNTQLTKEVEIDYDNLPQTTMQEQAHISESRESPYNMYSEDLNHLDIGATATLSFEPEINDSQNHIDAAHEVMESDEISDTSPFAAIDDEESFRDVEEANFVNNSHQISNSDGYEEAEQLFSYLFSPKQKNHHQDNTNAASEVHGNLFERYQKSSIESKYDSANHQNQNHDDFQPFVMALEELSPPRQSNSPPTGPPLTFKNANAFMPQDDSDSLGISVLTEDTTFGRRNNQDESSMMTYSVSEKSQQSISISHGGQKPKKRPTSSRDPSKPAPIFRTASALRDNPSLHNAHSTISELTGMDTISISSGGRRASIPGKSNSQALSTINGSVVQEPQNETRGRSRGSSPFRRRTDRSVDSSYTNGTKSSMKQYSVSHSEKTSHVDNRHGIEKKNRRGFSLRSLSPWRRRSSRKEEDFHNRDDKGNRKERPKSRISVKKSDSRPALKHTPSQILLEDERIEGSIPLVAVSPSLDSSEGKKPRRKFSLRSLSPFARRGKSRSKSRNGRRWKRNNRADPFDEDGSL